METWMWIVLAVAAVIVIAIFAYAAMRRRRSTQLRETFGPEYDRTVDRAGGVRQAESELRDRRERRESLNVQPLTPAARGRYEHAWEQTQARFVDDPTTAVTEADELVRAVMRERGYPVEDFEQRAADVSVDHPDVVEHYRAANTVSIRAGNDAATTEELRQGLVHYRALFAELLEPDPSASREAG